MTFASDIRKYAEVRKMDLKEVVIESLFDLSASVIIKTPIKTGFLANNWQPTQDMPASGIVEARSTDEEIKSTIAASLGGSYYLVNNLPYAKPIEFLGHSDKAPQGMLRISIENYQTHIDNAISGLN